jgi:hypothetical protein
MKSYWLGRSTSALSTSRPGDTGGVHDHPKATASIDFLITLVLAILEFEPLHMSRWVVITSRAGGWIVGVPGEGT